MFIQFADVNNTTVHLNGDAIWAVTKAIDGVCEVLLVGGEKSVKIDADTANDLIECLH